MPCVSVIIPTFNRQAFIREAIASVLGQTFQDFEIVVVDDGSTDATRATVEAIEDGRIRYVYQQNAGLSAARNRGLREARGEFVAFLDSDDTFLPEKLARQVRDLREHPAVGLTAGGWLCVDEAGQLLSRVAPKTHLGLSLEDWLVDCPFIVHAVLLRRAWAERAGGFDPDFTFNEDWDFWLRLAHLGCRMKWGDDLVCAYRLHPATMTGASRSFIARSRPFILDKYFSTHSDIPEPILAQKDRFYARAHLSRAFVAFDAGDAAAFQQQMESVVRFKPDWVSECSDEFLDVIVSFANSKTDQQPLDVAKKIVGFSPEAISDNIRFAASLYSRLAMSQAYLAYNGSNLAEARSHILLALRYDPRWLRSRGVLSLLAESVVGRDITNLLRAAKRAFVRMPHNAAGIR